MDDLHAMQTWIAEECERRHQTWREASISAGLNPGAISSIMTGARPGLQVCVSLADYFEVLPEYMLRLAGHLPPRKEVEGLSPVAIRKFEYLSELTAQLSDRDQVRLADALISLVDIVLTNGREPDESESPVAGGDMVRGQQQGASG